MRRALFILLSLIALFASADICLAQEAEGLYTVTGDKVHVRAGPGTGYAVLSDRNKGDIITVLSFYDSQWAKIRYGADKSAYISRKYIRYSGPIPVIQPTKEKQDRPASVLDIVFKILKILAIAFVCIGLVVSFFDAEAAGKLFTPFAFYLVGYVVGFLFRNAHLGAVIGEGVGFLILIINAVGDDFSLDDFSDFFRNITFYGWKLAAWPFLMLDRLQLFLSKPWRGFMKKNWAKDKNKEKLRTTFSVLKVPFYLLLFPLRLLNAVYYNLFVHLSYELSNYFLEVFAPSDSSMGRGNAGKWILMFPVRVVFYLVYHFTLTVIESVVWTVIDTFIPAVTLFHGTWDDCAAEMVSEPHRTSESRRQALWRTGTWNVGAGNYAGDGIYFGISRKTLNNYQRGSCIAARVSMGSTIDVSLMPNEVYNKAGSADAHDVSKWGITHGYTTGEWWREYPGWWEFCLFDRKNRYNYSWRIRPIYVLNYRKGIMQRIPRGSAHWLFRKMVLKDIGTSLSEFFSSI